MQMIMNKLHFYLYRGRENCIGFVYENCIGKVVYENCIGIVYENCIGKVVYENCIGIV